MIKGSRMTMMVPCVSKFFHVIIYLLCRRHKFRRPVRIETVIVTKVKCEIWRTSREKTCWWNNYGSGGANCRPAAGKG